MTTLEELQRGLIKAYEQKGKGLTDFWDDLKSLMETGMSRERALIHLALENNIAIEEIKELEKRGLSRDEASREFQDKLKRTQELYSIYTPSEGTIKASPSWTWYLLPIFCALLGGLIAYVCLTGEDDDMAKNLFFIGLGVTFIYAFLGWTLFLL